VPTIFKATPARAAASMASSIRLYGTSAETTRNQPSGVSAPARKNFVSTGAYSTVERRL
jgi:hypothetical protein